MVHKQGKTETEHAIRNKPNICPICKHNIDPKEVAKQPWDTGASEYLKRADVAYVCPRSECQRMFIGIFHCASITSGGRNAVNYEFFEALPNIPLAPRHDIEVATVSESFVEIYRQASFAEEYGLGDIAGGAYRKALEFLIKDYCTKKFPDKEKQIKRLQLGGVIAEYVKDPNVKLCANRAAWLGNDEIHYERRWVDKDIDDLKILIRLASNWIANELLTEKYVNEMRGKST